MISNGFNRFSTAMLPCMKKPLKWFLIHDFHCARDGNRGQVRFTGRKQAHGAG
jgi:hypothetical protein